MGWLVLLSASALLFVINKRVNVRGGGRIGDIISVVTMLVAIIAGCGFAYTVLGRLFAGLVNGIGSVAAKFGGSGAALGVSIATMIILVGIAVCDILCDRKADGGAQIAAYLFPTVLALVIGGSMGVPVETVLHEVGGAVSQLGSM